MATSTAFETDLLRETVRAFFRDELTPERVREYDSARRYPESVWQRLGELGWLALPVSERYGGVGADVRTSVVMTEELARGFASLAVDWVLVSMSARLIETFGTEAQKEELLPKLAAGEVTTAFGMSEPDGGTDVLGLRTRARLHEGQWLIKGQKLYTSMADESAYIIVLCRTDDAEEGKKARGLSLILTPTDQPALQIRRLQLMGMRAAGTCEVFLDDAQAPATAIVGERGRGFYHLLSTLDNERILAAAISLGIAEGALEEMTRYAKERHAFGRPIGSFQAVQHPIADSATEVKAMRLLVEHAADLQSAGEDCSTESTMAKLFAGEVVNRVTDRGMRILGGYGLVEESPMERHFRDARLQVFSPISNEMARNFIGERLGLPKSY